MIASVLRWAISAHIRSLIIADGGEGLPDIFFHRHVSMYWNFVHTWHLLYIGGPKSGVRHKAEEEVVHKDQQAA
jgi:hypothetical protein